MKNQTINLRECIEISKKYKVILLFVILLILVIASTFAYNKYKMKTLEEDVFEYVIKEKKVSENDLTGGAYYSKLQGDKKYLVDVKIKGDPNIYAYYRTKNNQIKLESYTDENRVEHVED